MKSTNHTLPMPDDTWRRLQECIRIRGKPWFETVIAREYNKLDKHVARERKRIDALILKRMKRLERKNLVQNKSNQTR